MEGERGGEGARREGRGGRVVGKARNGGWERGMNGREM